MNAPSTDTPTYRLETLGALRLTHGDAEVLRRRRKELALLAYLALQLRPVRREELAALFWGDKNEGLARQSLRQSLVKLRRAVPEALDISESHVAARPDGYEVDAERFAAAAATDPAGAVAAWGGEFLEGCDDLGTEEWGRWIGAERLRLRGHLCRALEAVAHEAADRADPAAIQFAARWSATAPEDERAHAHLITLLERAGRSAEALEHHARFVRRLEERGGRPPSVALEGVVAAIALRQMRSTENLAGSAALLTPDLIARDAAMAALESAWVAVEGGGGVTVVIEGEPGSGRSRLAAEFARRLRRRGGTSVVVNERGADLGRLAELLLEKAGAAGAAPASLAALAADDRTSDLTAAGRDLIEAVAAEAPLSIVVDEVALTGIRLAALLASLVREPVASVLLVLTADADLPDGIARALRSAPDARRVKLRRLTEPETGSLIASMLPIDTADRDRLAALLQAETGGLPLQIVDCVAALADSGDLHLAAGGHWRLAADLDQRPLPLPASVIAMRLGRLSAAARAVIGAIARGTPRASAEELAARTGLTSTLVESAIGELVARRLLRPVDDAARSYELPAGSLRDAVITAMPEADAASVPGYARKAPRRTMGIAAGLGALTLLSAAVAARALGPGDLELRSDRVVVMPLENRTGRSGLESTGRVAAEWLAQGIGRSGLLQVVPIDAEGTAREVAAAAGAAMVITGSYSASGDSLAFTAGIIDVATGEARATLPVARGTAANPAGAIESLRQSVLGALAGYSDGRLAAAARAGTLPPSWDVYRAFAQGLDHLYARRGEAANAAFEGAYRLDTTFMLPLAYLAFSLDGQGRMARRDSIARVLGSRRAAATPYEQAIIDFLGELEGGDLAGRYAAARRAALLAPGSMMAGYYYPRAAIGINRPREAVAALDAADPARDEIAGMPGYWSMLSMALHMVEDYDRQLEVGRRVEADLPKDSRGLNYQVRALAALGRVDSLEAILSRAFLVPRAPGWDALGLSLHTLAFDELRAHGHEEVAASFLARAVASYEQAPDSVQRVPRQRLEMARALQRLGRNTDARGAAETLIGDSTVRGEVLVAAWEIAGAVAAIEGDTARAAAADRWLARGGEKYSYGTTTQARAGIAALQGRRDDAVRLLQQAVTEGLGFDNNRHLDFELQSLRGYAPFEAWLRPKG